MQWEYYTDFVYSSEKDFHFEEMNSLAARDSFSRCALQKLQLNMNNRMRRYFLTFSFPVFYNKLLIEE